jgi:hypothetical protein
MRALLLPGRPPPTGDSLGLHVGPTVIDTLIKKFGERGSHVAVVLYERLNRQELQLHRIDIVTMRLLLVPLLI